MQKKPMHEFYREMVIHLTDRRFLKSMKLSKKEMLALLKEKNWKDYIISINGKDKVYCADVLEMCQAILNTLSVEPKEGWLNYIYGRTLGQLFPDNTSTKKVSAFETGRLFYLEVLRFFLKYERETKPFNPKSHFQFLNEDEIKKTDTAEEYRRFLGLFKDQYLYEFMRIGAEITRHKTIDHISGVHYIAMHVGRQLLRCNVPIDMALVSGSAVGHDIGKYGCRPEEAKRIPYLHYYYTDKYFKRNQMPSIGHIATNHSTWDLELENLSVESLVLIYADFRVKSEKNSEGTEAVSFFNLKDSFGVILNKLDNVDEAKRDRYIKVYSKLKDFEDYMVNLGINTDLTTTEIQTPDRKDTALLNSDEVVRTLKHLAIRHNIMVMHKMNSETAFSDIIEAARSEKDWKNSRAYINIFQEYFTYMTQKQKMTTLNFLYELLMHREGDIRRQSADLMGKIIVHFDEEYRKELPEGVKGEPGEITSLDLWEKYLKMVILPDHKVTEQHKRWLGYTLKLLVGSVLQRCKKQDTWNYIDSFIGYYREEECDDSSAFILLDSILTLPLSLCTPDDQLVLMRFADRMSRKNSLEVRLAALRFASYLAGAKDVCRDCIPIVQNCLKRSGFEEELSIAYLKYKIQQNLKLEGPYKEAFEARISEEQNATSEIFLENLKAATPWVIKAVNLEFLLDQIQKGNHSQILQVAAHLSNLIKVSERVTVRHSAGQALLTVMPLLTLTQRNEIAVELSKGLEIGAYEFSKYIPEYLGKLALQLHPNELDELILDFKKLLNSNNDRVCSVTLDTLGVMLQAFPLYQERFGESHERIQKRQEVVLGLILKGLSNYHEVVSQEAFLVIGQYLFGTEKLSLDYKYEMFSILYKKMLTLITDQKETELSFFNSSASLNQIYRFLSDYLFFHNDFELPVSAKVAFFPGSFDPFSLGHKGILEEIRNLGFETYLAIDEFSWSKKTQPKMIRRKIISMTTADEKDVFLFPDDIPINIANPSDLKKLKELFSPREVYIVVGSDVIEHASSYQVPAEENSIHSFPHLIFKRFDNMEKYTNNKMAGSSKKYPMISGHMEEFVLPPKLEEISSSKIRENIDYNRDIANLIDPLAQSYIYDNSIYLREPQYKYIFSGKQIKFEIVTEFGGELIDELSETIFRNQSSMEPIREYLMRKGTNAVVVRDGSHQNVPVGIAAFHAIGMADIFDEFGSLSISSYIRRITSGRIIVLSGIAVTDKTSIKNVSQLALTEALAYCLKNDFTHAIYHNHLGDMDKELPELLDRQGFVCIRESDPQDPIYSVDMKFPVTLFRDIENCVKEPFNQLPKVLNAIEEAHRKMQRSISGMYPGNLVLSFDSGVMNNQIVDKIADLNQVPNEPLALRKLGASMCVPFGKILKGSAVPNTVTKSLHTEKRFEPGISRFQITELPYHSPLINQIRTIKSFRRPVLLVDDLLHKGYRMKELDPLLKQENIQVSELVVGILSGRGKDLMEIQNRKVESVYFIPNLRSWFDESGLYPFLGGDGVHREGSANAGLIPSVNLILPYVAPNFLMDVPKAALYDFSMTCLENARDILTAVEEEYQAVYERKLTLNRLSEAINSPRYPDKGINMSYDLNLAPSLYLSNDIESLIRLESLIL